MLALDVRCLVLDVCLRLDVRCSMLHVRYRWYVLHVACCMLDACST